MFAKTADELRFFSIGISALLSGWFALLTPLIPEVEKSRSEKKSILEIVATIPQVTGHMPFCAYCF